MFSKDGKVFPQDMHHVSESDFTWLNWDLPLIFSSVAFLSFSFVAFYFMGKLNVFNENGRGSGTKLSFCLAPIVVATLISISRTCDYHHHYLDVLVGSILGTLVSYMCYRQYYPALDSNTSAKPYPLRNEDNAVVVNCKAEDSNSSDSETQGLLVNNSS